MNLALFDFDGTITSREMFPDFMRFAVTPGRLAVGQVVLMPLVVGYKLGVVTGNTIRSSVVRFGFRGIPMAQVEQAGERFSREVLPGVIRPMALERIQWHKAQGDVVVVVSAALDLYLAHWCRQHQLDLICSRLEVEDGVLTGRYRGEQCSSKEKSRRILETYNIRDFPVVYAYGDTKEDMDMLSLASRKYFRWEEVA
jgi:phosphatidylglycerophosphatase C